MEFTKNELGKIVVFLKAVRDALTKEKEVEFEELKKSTRRKLYEVYPYTMDLDIVLSMNRIGCIEVDFDEEYPVPNDVYIHICGVDEELTTLERANLMIEKLQKIIETPITLALLNTSIITEDGQYTLETIDLDHAKELVASAEALDSAIGHDATAQIMTTLLGAEVAVNRQIFAQQIGQVALVFKLNGRPPEGTILTLDEIEKIGYTWKMMTRIA